MPGRDPREYLLKRSQYLFSIVIRRFHLKQSLQQLGGERVKGEFFRPRPVPFGVAFVRRVEEKQQEITDIKEIIPGQPFTLHVVLGVQRVRQAEVDQMHFSFMKEDVRNSDVSVKDVVLVDITNDSHQLFHKLQTFLLRVFLIGCKQRVLDVFPLEKFHGKNASPSKEKVSVNAGIPGCFSRWRIDVSSS